jgi:hypothetical protein
MIRLARTVEDWVPWIYLVIITFAVIILTIMFVWIVHQNNDIRRINRQHSVIIHRIQAARLESCEATYRSIGEIFHPFLKGKSKDPNVIKFYGVIHTKIKGCPDQVNVHMDMKGG